MCVFTVQVVEHLVRRQPAAVAGISALLEGVREAAPDLVPPLLALAAPSLTPRNSCQEGDYIEVGEKGQRKALKIFYVYI